MCRLMGFTAISPMAIKEIAGENFDAFAKLADRHRDGWGFSTDSTLLKEVVPALVSNNFETAVSKDVDAALLHFRFASTGINIQETNSHPFMRDGISFIHNGTIKPAATVDPFIETELLDTMTGTTDSEKYFLAILSLARRTNIKNAFLQTVRNIKATGNYSSLNAMVLTRDYYLVVAEHDNTRIPKDEPSDYYKLAYKKDSNGIIVASSGWDQSGWIEIPNHTLMAVNRATLELDFVSI